MKIALVDYGAGNLTSVRKALAAAGAAVVDPLAPKDLDGVTGVIVPGVGHFGATRALGPAWIDAIRSVVEDGRPLLGICLGMQWMYEGSDEAPDCGGLGIFSGRCYRLGGGVSASSSRIKVPHVGWNTLEMRCRASIVKDVADGSQVYFTHSFVAPITAETVAVTEHGESFASIVQQGLVAGVQFHPEKSGDVGLQVLRNWLALAE